jgi:hypothetical protein
VTAEQSVISTIEILSAVGYAPNTIRRIKMQTMFTRKLAETLRVHPARIEQWISKGQFLNLDAVENGKGRAWSFVDALRLAVFVTLVDVVGVRPADAGLMTFVPFRLFDGTKTLFVGFCDRPEVMTGWKGASIPAETLPAFLAGCCERPVPMSDETVAGLPAFASIVLDLDAIAADLRKGWEG